MDTFKPALAGGSQFNLLFLTAWFGAAFTCLILSILFFTYLSTPKIINPVSQSFKLYSALPENSIQVSEKLEPLDARPKIIENFFKEYDAPLAEFSEVFVKVSNKYQLDYRLLPSIAMQESHGGKKVIKDSFNPFGYGIYGKLVLKFASWEEGIERVGKALREDYLNNGLKTPQQIMTKYTPPSQAKGGNWAKGVSTFIQELQ